MIKESVKKYFKNMRYLIMVLGILFLALLVCSSVIAKGAVDNFLAASGQILNYLKSNSLSFAPIGDAVKNGGSFFKALGDVVGNYSGLLGTIVGGVSMGIVKVAGVAFIALLIFMTGILVSHDVIFVLSRYNKEGHNAVEALFELFVRDLFIALYIIIIIYFFTVEFLKTPALILLAVFPVMFCFLSLLAEWLAAGSRRPPFTSVVTVKNIALLLLEDIISICMSLVLSAVVYIFFGVLIGIFVSLALLILGVVSVSLNAQAFIHGENSWIIFMPEQDDLIESKENIVE